MKKFILFSIVVLCTIFLYGCSDVTFEVKVDETGQIYQTATIQPDYELLKSKGFSKEYVNEEILRNYIIYIDKLKNNFALFECENIDKTALLERTKFSSPIFNDGTITFEIIFSQYNDYFYFYCHLPSENQNPTLIKNNFFWMSQSTTFTPFYNLNEQNELVKEVEKSFSINKICPFNINDLNFTYTYATCDRLQRSDADEVYYSNGIYYHSWKNVSPNQKIYFFKFIKILSYNWYMLALALTIVLFVILLIVNEFKRKHKKYDKEYKIDEIKLISG